DASGTVILKRANPARDGTSRAGALGNDELCVRPYAWPRLALAPEGCPGRRGCRSRSPAPGVRREHRLEGGRPERTDQGRYPRVNRHHIRRGAQSEHLTTATTMFREMGMTYWLKQVENATASG